MASGPEEPITRTFTVFPRHPAPVVAFVSALFIPVSVTVLTLKYVVALFQVSSIAVVIPVESQATAARDPCPNSIGDPELSETFAAKVVWTKNAPPATKAIRPRRLEIFFLGWGSKSMGSS
jgi:hypothetical protein